MSGNTSWLKKADARPSMRALQLNLGDINKTMTMQNGDSENHIKHPKRKSVLKFTDLRMYAPAGSAKKAKLVNNSASTTVAFRDRTLKMVGGRTSMVPRPGVTKRTSNILRRPEPKIQSTPLHMSTPCEAPQSILRSSRFPRKPLSAKKVIFDTVSTEDGVCPLQESTINDFPQFDLRKVPPAKVDAATNTEREDVDVAIQVVKKETDSSSEVMLNFLKEISSKLDRLLENGNCGCNTPLLRVNPLKNISQFMTHLDDIQEVSENPTPILQEVSQNASSPPSATTSLSDATPKIKIVECGPVVVVGPVLCENDNNVDTHSEEIVGSSTESATSASSLAITSDGETNSKRRSSRLQTTNHVDSPQPTISRLRKFRKRGPPRYLDSFELSPKVRVKGRKQSE